MFVRAPRPRAARRRPRPPPDVPLDRHPRPRRGAEDPARDDAARLLDGVRARAADPEGARGLRGPRPRALRAVPAGALAALRHHARTGCASSTPRVRARLLRCDALISPSALPPRPDARVRPRSRARARRRARAAAAARSDRRARDRVRTIGYVGSVHADARASTSSSRRSTASRGRTSRLRIHGEAPIFHGDADVPRPAARDAAPGSRRRFRRRRTSPTAVYDLLDGHRPPRRPEPLVGGVLPDDPGGLPRGSPGRRIRPRGDARGFRGREGRPALPRGRPGRPAREAPGSSSTIPRPVPRARRDDPRGPGGLRLESAARARPRRRLRRAGGPTRRGRLRRPGPGPTSGCAGVLDPYATVFIPTWNGGPLFERVLDKVLAQKTSFDYEVLVIDSGSKDGTVDAVRRRPAGPAHRDPEQRSSTTASRATARCARPAARSSRSSPRTPSRSTTGWLERLVAELRRSRRWPAPTATSSRAPTAIRSSATG